MIIKISVKKLHQMEQMYKNRIKANRRTYRAEVAGWRTENEALKKKVGDMFNDRHNFEEDLERADKSLKRMDERIEAYKQEIEHLRERDRTWQKDFAASNSRCKALDEQCEMLKLEVEDLKREDQAETINYLTDENDALKRKIEALEWKASDLKR